jgi:hypothetical protein
MQSPWFNNLILPNRFYRLVAIFFLMFTAIDLGCPSFCQEDGLSGEPETGRQIAASWIGSQREFLSPCKSDDSSDKPGQTSELKEDCFCCCSHLIPACHFNIAILNETPRVIVPTIPSLPSAPGPEPFHPPRFWV